MIDTIYYYHDSYYSLLYDRYHLLLKLATVLLLYVLLLYVLYVLYEQHNLFSIIFPRATSSKLTGV